MTTQAIKPPFSPSNVATLSDVAYFTKSNCGVIKSVRVQGSHVVQVTVCGSGAYVYADKVILKDCAFDWLQKGFSPISQVQFKAFANTKHTLSK